MNKFLSGFCLSTCINICCICCDVVQAIHTDTLTTVRSHSRKRIKLIVYVYLNITASVVPTTLASYCCGS